MTKWPRRKAEDFKQSVRFILQKLIRNSQKFWTIYFQHLFPWWSYFKKNESNLHEFVPKPGKIVPWLGLSSTATRLSWPADWRVLSCPLLSSFVLSCPLLSSPGLISSLSWWPNYTKLRRSHLAEDTRQMLLCGLLKLQCHGCYLKGLQKSEPKVDKV